LRDAIAFLSFYTGPTTIGQRQGKPHKEQHGEPGIACGKDQKGEGKYGMEDAQQFADTDVFLQTIRQSLGYRVKSVHYIQFHTFLQGNTESHFFFHNRFVY